MNSSGDVGLFILRCRTISVMTISHLNKGTIFAPHRWTDMTILRSYWQPESRLRSWRWSIRRTLCLDEVPRATTTQGTKCFANWWRNTWPITRIKPDAATRLPWLSCWFPCLKRRVTVFSSDPMGPGLKRLLTSPRKRWVTDFEMLERPSRRLGARRKCFRRTYVQSKSAASRSRQSSLRRKIPWRECAASSQTTRLWSLRTWTLVVLKRRCRRMQIHGKPPRTHVLISPRRCWNTLLLTGERRKQSCHPLTLWLKKRPSIESAVAMKTLSSSNGRIDPIPPLALRWNNGSSI